jgi:uncharacterized membrane protein YphA (DoxX/SURF4 family)
MAQDAKMKLAWRIIGLLVGAVFIFAGVTKLIELQPFRFLDPMEFARGIDNYKMLPWPMNVGLAFYLPWLEIICGLALIFRRWQAGALAILLSLMLVFIGATVAAKMRGIDISCGCFGHLSDQLSFAWHLVLDFAILAGLGGLLMQFRAPVAQTSAKSP